MASISGSVEFRYGRYKYMGWALPDSEDEQHVRVVFNKTYDDQGHGQQMKIRVSETDVKRRKMHTPKYLSEGWCVDFLSRERGLQKGRVERVHGCQADIIYYYIDEEGYPQKVEEKRVNFDRIIDVSMLRNNMRHVPFQSGEKVIAEDNDDSVVIGEVCGEVDPSGMLNVETIESGSKGKDVKRKRKYHFTQLRKLETKDGTLRRSDFISDWQEQDILFNAEIKKQIQRQQLRTPNAKAVEPVKPLYWHQLAGCELAEKYNRFAFFYDTGTGKTAMALNIIANKYQKYGAKFLIIAPISIIKTAWMDDQKVFFPDMRILPLQRSFKHAKQRALLQEWRERKNYPIRKKLRTRATHREICSELEQNAQHYIINPELFIKKPMEYIEKYGITGLLMDESAVLKNYYGVTSKCLRNSTKGLEFVYMLSGKPAPNNVIEYFSQMCIVAPEQFPFSFETFLNTFCYLDDDRRWKLIPFHQGLFADMVSSKSLVISKRDCLDLPDIVSENRLFELPEKCMQLHDRLFKNQLAVIKGWDSPVARFSSKWKSVRLMKLRQISSGFFMYPLKRGLGSKCIVLHRKKVEELEAVLLQMPSEQVIIWCQFQYEIELLEKELAKYGKVVTAYGKTIDKDQSIDAFKSGEAKYLLALPRTLKYGVTFTNCKYAVYYSLSYSAEEYDQSHDRNYRLGQTESCTYIHLQAADTIDEVIYKKVMKKLSDAEFFEELIKYAAKHGIDYSILKPKSKEEAEQELIRILDHFECDMPFDEEFDDLD